MPGNTTGGISRKIENDDQRVKLKKIVNELKFPDNVGVIVRTEKSSPLFEQVQLQVPDGTHRA